MESSGAPGRARGRARGRASTAPTVSAEEASVSMQAIRISPVPGDDGNGGEAEPSNGFSSSDSSNGNNSNGNGNGNGSAVRGRGGFRGTNGDEIDTRPPNVKQYKGDAGKEIALYSNYFRLTTPTNAVVQTYHIDFEPNIEAIYLRRKMIYSITELFDKPFIFDGMSNIKTTSVQREDRSVVVQNPADQSDVHIKIRHTGEIPWGSHEMMRMYNTQMRKNLRHIGYVLMGRNYFDRRSKKTIPEFNIELWPGIVSAINQHDGGILMVIDSSTKFVRAETVLQLLSKIRQQAGDNWLEAAKKELCGSIVMTSYNSKTYRVDDLNPNINPTTTFRKNDKEISLIDYYKQSYDVVIRQHTQPLLECLPNARDRRAGRTEKIWLVPELCSMTGLTDKMRSDFNLMRKIGDVSRLPPDQRVNALTEFISKVSSNPDVKKEMDDWGLAFERQLVEVQARQLTCEKIFTGNDDEYSAQTFNQRMGDFSKEIRSKQLHAMCTINRWVLVADPKNHGLVEEFCQTLKRVCTPMGINLFQPKRELLQDDRINTYVQVCQRYGPPCEMIVLLVPNNNKDRYDAIKKICYCENPMPSQVVVHRTIVKKQMLMSVCTKIAIQMACKMGGEPWALKIPPKDIMVVGYDTYHDSSTRGRSVGGFVCSMNGTLTSWYSRVAFHSNQEEMSKNFAINLTDGIKKYFERNHSLPNRVLVYRDGVGDGMIPHVFDYELRQIRDALKAINADKPPSLSFTIVTKRVNARFFSKSDQRFENPIPGTIIDSVVTREKRYDFYLISQSVRQGTVTPTMYNIIWDESSLKPTHHQQLAYKLTHLYFNWAGTIRVPAPCQYAHKLAYLTGTSLHREPNVNICDRLFYL